MSLFILYVTDYFSELVLLVARCWYLERCPLYEQCVALVLLKSFKLSTQDQH